MTVSTSTDPAAVLAVTFDFGQTLAELDSDMLARRAGERGVRASAAAIDAALPAAWRAYDSAVRAGVSGHPWKLLMRTLLDGAHAEGDLPALVDWLWDEQPRRNLWRRPIPGMIELVDALRAAGVPVGVVSNSEGRLADLVDELGWGDRFVCIADSGRLGVEKPARGIFDWAAEQLGVPLDRVAHVGDSRAADAAGAAAAGAFALWYGPGVSADGLAAGGEALAAAAAAGRAAAARDAAEAHARLAAWTGRLL